MDEEKGFNHITYVYLMVSPGGVIFSITNERGPHDWVLEDGSRIVGVRRINWGELNG